ncbi:monofunctional biosynthetic peptidoglycan transglycosylase [bacterium]|nr:monofunctional biosynthetic peptidoglycan transglycosylase [bacterium]
MGKFFKFSFFAILFAASLMFFDLPNMGLLLYKNPKTTAFMGEYLDKRDKNNALPPLKQTYIPYSSIASSIKAAVLIGEDDTFFEHEGFNWVEIEKAFKKNIKAKKYKRGASTISQQLVKNLYLSRKKSIWRKLHEWMLTIQMEHTLPKKRILELYLNYIEWGEGIYGVQEAARHYFNTDASKLSREQAAYLAAIIPNPVVYGSGKKPKTVSLRTNIILSRLSRGDYILDTADKKN